MDITPVHVVVTLLGRVEPKRRRWCDDGIGHAAGHGTSAGSFEYAVTPRTRWPVMRRWIA